MSYKNSFYFLLLFTVLFLANCQKTVNHSQMELTVEALVQAALKQGQMTRENYVALYQDFEKKALAKQGISDQSEISTEDWALLNMLEERNMKKIEDVLPPRSLPPFQ